jgi:hypothetical protein
MDGSSASFCTGSEFTRKENLNELLFPESPRECCTSNHGCEQGRGKHTAYPLIAAGTPHRLVRYRDRGHMFITDEVIQETKAFIVEYLA